MSPRPAPSFRSTAFQRAFLALVPLLATSTTFAQSDTTLLVSMRESGASSIGPSRSPSLTAEGRVIVFQSVSRNLVVGDSNGVLDVFLRRRRPPQTTVRVSVSSSGAQGNGPSTEPSISAAGRHVAFTSRATNLVGDDFNFVSDVFVHDRTLLTTTRVSLGVGGVEGDDHASWPSISGDGRFVAFQSAADNLVPGDVLGCGGAHPCAVGVDVFVRDRTLATTTRVSTFADGSTLGLPGLGSKPSISADGTAVAFESAAGLVPGDVNAASDVYVKSLVTGVLVRASAVTSTPNTLSRHALSGDGTRVVWRNFTGQIWMYDALTGITQQVSRASNGQPADAVCSEATISDDGAWAAFTTTATNLAPGATGRARVLYANLNTGEFLDASVNTFGASANADCGAPALNANGRWAAFTSEATNLVEDDPNHVEDVFLRDREPPVAFAFCSGDSTGGACPCGNIGVRGRGCENSFGTGGTQLFADGTPSVALDTLTFQVLDYGPETFAILLQADDQAAGGIGTPFGDGLQCLAGNVIVLGARQANLGVCAFGQDAGDPPLSVTGAIPPLGKTVYYQALYRNGQSYCTPAEFNTTNGVRVPWVP